MTDERDFYNRDGNILRVRTVAAGFVEIELDFVGARREDALLYSIAALYLAFTVKLKVSYVFSSYTFKRVVVRSEDFTPDAERELARAIEVVRARSGVLFSRAELHFHGKQRGKADTSTVAELERFKKTDLEGREFLEAVASALA